MLYPCYSWTYHCTEHSTPNNRGERAVPFGELQHSNPCRKSGFEDNCTVLMPVNEIAFPTLEHRVV